MEKKKITYQQGRTQDFKQGGGPYDIVSLTIQIKF